MDITEQRDESWQVEAAGGEVFDTTFGEMTAWIADGSLLRIDRVRKGNLRWIEAGKVPSLLAIFNARDNGELPATPVITTTAYAPATTAAPAPPPSPAETLCSIHPDVPAAYTCETCGNVFCKACPASYGGTVKICPFCGAMCKSIAQVEKARVETTQHSAAISSGFGFGDFAEALAYPFKFKTSLIFGALMFMFFSIGQSAAGMGSMFLVGAALISFMMANTLTFGVLANTVQNFSQGKIGLNFMPSFDDFSLWDDVVHPFFLSVGVYISSFGPLIAMFLIAVFFLVGAVRSEMNGMQEDAARVVNPQLPYAADAAKQSERVRDLLQKDTDRQEQRIAEAESTHERMMSSIERGEDPDEELVNQHDLARQEEQFSEERIAELQNMIHDSRKAQLESVVGKAPETVAGERAEMLQQILGYGALFIILAGICLLWGLFYFPAACAVAGYTRSFTATINPAVGIDTIRRLGGSYFKVLLMGAAIAFMSAFVGGVFGALLSPFDMPGVGNLPATAISSLFGFYFSIVFSCVLGFAMYKASDRLKLFQ